MKNNVYKCARFLERRYRYYQGIDTKVADNVILHDTEFRYHRYGSERYLPRELKLIANYYSGAKSAKNQTESIKNLQSLLFMYTTIFGYKRTYFYKLLITANNHTYQYHGDHLIDQTGSSAIKHLSSVIVKFKKRLHRIHSNYQPEAIRIRLKYYHQLHVHGIISSRLTNYRTISSKWSEWLSNQLGYSVTAKLTPLINFATGMPVIITSSHPYPNSNYNAIQQWLTYINRSNKLAFPNTQHPNWDVNNWNHLTHHQQSEYVKDTISSTTGVTLNFNRSYKRAITHIKHKARFITKLAMIKATMYDNHIVQQQSLFSLQSIDNNPESAYYKYDSFHGQHQHHHYTYLELWQRAKRYQFITNQDRLENGAKLLLEVITSNQYIITPKYNKIATKIIGDGQNQYITTTNDRMRASGIPPPHNNYTKQKGHTQAV